MTLKEFEEAIKKIKALYPNAEEMEIGPVFSQGIMMVSDLTIESKAGWDNNDAIGIHWHC